MRKRAVLILVVLFVAFTAGLVHLFQLRFEGGDVYPAYSSLRADPLGTKAFHDSLAELLPVRRNFEPLLRLGDGRGLTLLYLGASPVNARFATNQFQAFETFVRSGGRLVMTFSPEYFAPRPNRFGPPTPKPRRRPAAGTNQAPIPRRGVVGTFDDWHQPSVQDRWKVEFGFATLERDEGTGAHRAVQARRLGGSTLPEHVPVNTALYFDKLDPAWQVLYSWRDATNERAVLIERRMGDGTLVLAADSYPFSNEALRQSRLPELLTWFVGGPGEVWIDETHLGTGADPGIAVMALRYHLHGLAAALAILAGLFIWRNSTSFIPPPPDELAGEASHQVAGKDSAEGFINLLRRNIPPVDILKICLEQWNHAAARGRKPSRAKLEAMQKLVDEQNALDPRDRNPVRTYQQFCAILSQRT